LPLKLSASETVETASEWLDSRTQAKAKIIPKKPQKNRHCQKYRFHNVFEALPIPPIPGDYFPKKREGKTPKIVKFFSTFYKYVSITEPCFRL